MQQKRLFRPQEKNKKKKKSPIQMNWKTFCMNCVYRNRQTMVVKAVAVKLFFY